MYFVLTMMVLFPGISTSTDALLLGISEPDTHPLYQNTTEVVLQCYLWGWHNLLSPSLGPRCRYNPSCSQYASIAIRERGAILGIILSAARLLRDSTLADGNYPTDQKGLLCDTPQEHW